MAFAETAELAARLTLKDEFSNTLNRAGGSLTRFQGSLGKIGSGVGKVGAGLVSIGEKAAIAAGGGLLAAAKASIDFQDAFAGVRKTVEASPAELEALNQQLRDLSTRIPVKFEDLAGIAQEAGALGVATKDVASFTETVSRLSAATVGLTTEGAAEAFGKLGNVLFTTTQKADGLSQEYQQLGSALIALGNAGASSEGDIIDVAKRFGAAGHQAGLSAAQVLGFSSAIASLGVQPEAAGSSLSRLFNRITTYIGTGSDKVQEFAKVSGVSVAQFKKSFATDASGAVQTFLKNLSGLNNFQVANVLKKAGITNIRDINAIQLLAQNWQELNRQVDLSTAAYAKNTDLLAVSEKRFDTLKSKLSELKNQFFVAAATIGDGFTPAVGRAAEKLAAFLRLPENQQALTKLGQDIGRFIDNIDWGQVAANAKTFVSVLQTAADWAVKLLDALNKLPTEVKAAGIAFLGLNKLSGGLLGKGIAEIGSGVIGGLGRSIVSKIPGVGALTATPVYVVNFPPGFGMPGVGGNAGGAAGAAGGGIGATLKSGLTGALKLALPAAIGAAIAVPTANVIRELAGISAEESARRQSLGQFGPRSLHNQEATTKAVTNLKAPIGNITPHIDLLTGKVNGIGAALVGKVGNITPHIDVLTGKVNGIGSQLVGKVGNITPELSRIGGKVDRTTSAVQRKKLAVTTNVHVSTDVAVTARGIATAVHRTASYGNRAVAV